MLNGIINVYKEQGFTSFDVCALMRGIAGQKKVGHTGTLDPQAEGVLPICLGNATKLCDMLTDKTKEYVAEFELGKKTDTLDIWGTVLEERTPSVSEESLREAILSFAGGYEQLPPMYSAKKVDGKRLYDLARAGKEVTRKPVFVDIFEIEILSIDYPKAAIRVKCGKGTYIRSLCEDIATKVGELACMTSLKRTAVAGSTADKALTLKDLQELKDKGLLSTAVLPTDSAFTDYDAATVKKDFRKLVDNGNKLTLSMIDGKSDYTDGEIVRIYNDEKVFTGLYLFVKAENCLKPFKMFIGE
ncbi:MAG: tRNA pseudouridine(55) synthase TruB [Lachnospiraceae bacterium]|nr:tRNA pseudouridine(55) synthase TruB [Lachnospiraceae bacterium]